MKFRLLGRELDQLVREGFRKLPVDLAVERANIRDHLFEIAPARGAHRHALHIGANEASELQASCTAAALDTAALYPRSGMCVLREQSATTLIKTTQAEQNTYTFTFLSAELEDLWPFTKDERCCLPACAEQQTNYESRHRCTANSVVTVLLRVSKSQ